MSTHASILAELIRQAKIYYSEKMLAKHLGVVPGDLKRWEAGEKTPGDAETIIAQLRELTAPAPDRPHDFTFIDLFAGIGGIRRGFEANGGKCVFTSEWNEFAMQTYWANFPGKHAFAANIRDVTQDEGGEADDEKIRTRVPDHDVLLAGFPCQPFSIAGVSKKNSLGKAHGFLCKVQGTLFFDVANIIRVKQPAAFLLENVKNLRSHNKGDTFRTIMDTLNALDYQVEAHIIDARHVVPQHRERIFIVGFRKDVDASGFSLAAVKQTLEALPPRRIGEILLPDDQIPEKYTLTDHLWNYLENYARKHKEKGNGFGHGAIHRHETARTLSARYHKDGAEILIRQEGRNPRRLTPKECALLMGYDPDIIIPVSDTQAYRQFGNSVVVPVIRAIAANMRPVILAHKARGARRTEKAA